MEEIKYSAENLYQESTQNYDNRIENLFIAARNARDASDSETALKHYEAISAIKPDSWEALFYLTLLKTDKITNGEISNAAVSITNCIPKVFQLINTTIANEENKKAAVQEVVDQCTEKATWLTSVNCNFYKVLTKNDLSFDILSIASNLDSKRKFTYEFAEREAEIGNILSCCGDTIELIFGLNDKFYQTHAVEAWKFMLLYIHFKCIETVKVGVYDEEFVDKYFTKIKRFDSFFELPDIKPTEKRNYNTKAIIIILAALAIGIFCALWYWFAFSY